MKAILIALVLTSAATTATKANDYCQPSYSYCAPRYICTKLLGQHVECRYGYDRCGNRYSFEVIVSTYADVYSDGSRNVYTRTTRA